MNPVEEIAQKYIDALDDPQCFCDGRLVRFEYFTLETQTYDRSPNCPFRDTCRLFDRQVNRSKTIKMWHPMAGREACLGYESWERFKEFSEWREQIENMSWRITILGRTFDLHRTTSEMAVMMILVKLKREGVVSNEDIYRIVEEKDYSVREL